MTFTRFRECRLVKTLSRDKSLHENCCVHTCVNFTKSFNFRVYFCRNYFHWNVSIVLLRHVSILQSQVHDVTVESVTTVHPYILR